MVEPAIGSAQWQDHAPTLDQMREFFDQIKAGQITRENFGSFLDNLRVGTEKGPCFVIHCYGSVEFRPMGRMR